jgi:spermidine synthase
MSPPAARPRNPAPAAVFLASLAVLLLELSLMRLFSATMHYHYAFIAISLALFGSGAAGVAIAVLPERFRERPLLRAGQAAAAMAPATALALCVALLVPKPAPVPEAPAGALPVFGIVCLYLACALPFLCGGAAIAYALIGGGTPLFRLYRADLLGAAAGGLLLVPLLDRLGGIDTVLVVPVLAALSSLLFARAGGGAQVGSLAVLAAAVVLLASNVAFGFLSIGDVKGVRNRDLVFSRWNSFSRVTVSAQNEERFLLVFIDADAATPITRNAGYTGLHLEKKETITALPYYILTRPEVLVLGPGGGDDVLMARLFEAPKVDAVEINPIIARDIVSAEPFRTYAAGLFELPGVRLIVDDARSFARRSGDRYDLIEATLVDTWAATATGAFSLTENYLYTVEAFRDFAARLRPDGLLAFTRWYFEPPDQMLRLAGLALEVMREQGVTDPERRLMVFRDRLSPEGRAPGLLLWKMSPFTDEEIDRLEGTAAYGEHVPLYTPRTRPDNDFWHLIPPAGRERFYVSYPTNVRPTTDDAPFFFNTLRPRDLLRTREAPLEWRKTNAGTMVLFLSLALATLLVLLFVFGPLLLRRGQALGGAGAAGFRLLLVFALIGAGFMVTEIVLVQKLILFLGAPVYALTVGLVGILFFSGLGSGWSGRIGDVRLTGVLRALLAAAGAVILGYAYLVSRLFDALVHLERPLRIAVATAAIAPLAVLLGMLMPSALRRVQALNPALLPWAWGVNGGVSVLGSIGAIVLGLAFGFTAALWTAAGLYLLAGIVLPSSPRT